MTGAYVHIPFCATRCDYCAFATWTDRAHLVSSYLRGVRTEVRRAVDAGMAPVDTVFVGGGTPSLVPAAGLAAVLAEIPTVAGAEVTVECNPDTVTDELLDAYVAAGVSRVSLGVQSMEPSVLRSLGRTHDPDNVARAVDAIARRPFATWSMDLIYGASGETLDEWQRTVDATLALEPPHVSAYALTIEPGTPLAVHRDRHPDDDDQADKYLVATERFGDQGLDWYEISSWSRPGHRCRHNLTYWTQGDYQGFGCAAHSHRAGRRWWNVRTPERYLAAIDADQDPTGGDEQLDERERRVEGLQLALRTRAGVPADSLAPADRARFADLLDAVDDRLVLNVTGRLLANEIALRLR